MTEKIDQIYRGHINALNRRMAEDQSRFEPYEDFLRHTAGDEGDDENDTAPDQ